VPRLRRVDCSSPGITRRRHGRGFRYLDESGRSLRDQAVLERIRSLAVPPAWEEVWICTDSNGHLQAVGTDAAGRRQYLYHPVWRARRDQQKFDEMVTFARQLPRLRSIVDDKLEGEKPNQERVLAGAVRLLDRGFFRIGSEAYAEENDSFGLATIERRHVSFPNGGALVFQYAGKGGKLHRQAIIDPEVHRLGIQLAGRRGGGPQFLAYKNGRRWVDVRSDEINGFIKELVGRDHSAKDFRTWHASVLAAVALGVSTRPESATGRKRAVTRAVGEVAHYLGNTPAVCRASYIDPRVIDRYQEGRTIAGTLERLAWAEELDVPATQGPIEKAVLALLSA
jgi:DNA topoisomerase I